MILRLSDSLARLLVVALAILLSAWLSFFAVRTAVARYGAEGDTDKRLQLAVRLEPGNPDYWYLLGRYQQYNLEHQDSRSAEASYKKAIALNPLHTDAWLELATAYELDGDFEEARTAYIHAKKSYPISADVSWRYGNFLLRQGDRIHAYTEMRRAIEADPQRAQVAFSRAYRSNPNIEEILEQLLPASPGVYLEVITQALRDNQLAVAETVWNQLIALHPRLTMINMGLVGVLLATRDYAAARRVWDQGVATMNLPPLLQLPGSVVWDPSFESGINDNFFSWRFKPIDQGVSIGFDRSEKLTGIQSLRLSFDGKHNPDLNAACILAIVQPKTTYHFAGWIKTNNITTENGVGFRVFSPDDHQSSILNTHELHGTLPWTLVEGTWTAVDTHQVQVCVTREPSDNPQVRISGTAWVDEVTLTAQPAEHRKP
jgi:tetratricopeptide (TPR) repeat protein